MKYLNVKEININNIYMYMAFNLLNVFCGTQAL